MQKIYVKKDTKKYPPSVLNDGIHERLRPLPVDPEQDYSNSRKLNEVDWNTLSIGDEIVPPSGPSGYISKLDPITGLHGKNIVITWTNTMKSLVWQHNCSGREYFVRNKC